MRDECIKVLIKDTKPKVDYKCALVSGASSQSGESVEVTDIGGTSTITKAEVTLEHTYSKNGYDSVWAGGSGKNKLRTTATEETVNGLSFSPDDDGTISVSGTSSEALTVTTDSEIYSKRVVENGYRLFDEIIGGSVVWNQQMRAIATPIVRDFADGDNYSIYVSATPNYYVPIQGHVYFIMFDADRTIADNNYVGLYVGAVQTRLRVIYENGSPNGIHCNIERALNSYTVTTFYANNYYGKRGFASGDSITIRSTMLIDLTQMFGTTIADYIYQLEQNSSGSGVALFKKLFNEDYYAYNVGTMMSVSTSSHELVGFNQWDEEWEVGSISGTTGEPIYANDRIRSKNFIPCFENTAYFYQVSVGNMTILYYDENESLLSYYNFNPNHNFTTPSGCRKMKFFTGGAYGTTYNNDICINISNTALNGTYEPYVKNTYSLSPLTLRGIPKLDNNKIVYSGDIYKSSGEVTRRYGEVDLGSLTWQTYSSYPNIFYADITGKANSNASCDVICSKYTSISANATALGNASTILGDKQITGFNNSASSSSYAYIKDTAYTDAATFKTAMNGVKLIYELATPTTESTTPYTKPQICEQGGTEEYIDYEVSQGNRDVSIPVGHNTFYADYVVSDEANLTESETYNVSSNLTIGYRDSSGMHTVTNSLTIPSGGSYEFAAYTGDGASVEPMIYQGDDSSYLPYENLGKFSEYESARLDVTANGETTSYMTLLNPANYGGSYDFVSGKETRTWGHIESYNGETLPTVWESDRDDYVAGTTPSVGAEVCYELATPTETQYTAQEIALTSGATSTLSSPQGNITVVVNQPLVGE